MSSLRAHNAHSRSRSVLGCRRRTEQRSAGSEQTLTLTVLDSLTHLTSATSKSSRRGCSNLKDCSSKSLRSSSRSAPAVSTPPVYPRPRRGVQARPPHPFCSPSSHRSGRLHNLRGCLMAPPTPTTAPPLRSRTTCRSPSASWRSMSTATCTGSAVHPLCPLFSRSSRQPHRHFGEYRLWRKTLWPRARVSTSCTSQRKYFSGRYVPYPGRRKWSIRIATSQTSW